MSSFPSQSRRTRDRTRGPGHRLRALRECALHFAPYGFRATWHHLIVSARIPYDLDDDPESLTRAVDELAAARDLVVPLKEARAVTRRREKAAGRRIAQAPSPWEVSPFIGFAHCPDLEHHPTAPLPVVVKAFITHHESGLDPATHCLVCGEQRPKASSTCPSCGVGPFRWQNPPMNADVEIARWKQIWGRAF